MDQTEKPIKTQFPEPDEELHHENGASKMFTKVKARAKKFKNRITKHGQSHEHTDHDVVEEDDEDDELEPEVIGAPVRGGVTDQPGSQIHPKEANVSAPEKIVPPETKVFPVVSSDYTKPNEPVSLQDTSYGHEALSDPVRMTDTSEKEQRREEPTHYPTGYNGESGTSLGEDFPANESNGYGEESEVGLEKKIPARSDDVKVETELGRDLPTETHDQFSPELSLPRKRDDFEESRDSFEETRDETHEPKPSSYTEEIYSATSAIINKAIATKNAVSSKLGYSGESPKGDETQVAETFDEKLTPVNETESTMTKELPLSGGGSELEEKQREEVEKGVSARNYLAEKLRPGEEDKALSELITEKLHLGGGEKKTTMTKEVEKIPSEKVPKEKEHGEAVAEEVKGGGGMVGMIKGWFGGGTTEEVKPKSPHSVEESSQSLGSTVGTMGFSDSDRSELGETGGGSGVVPVRRELGN